MVHQVSNKGYRRRNRRLRRPDRAPAALALALITALTASLLVHELVSNQADADLPTGNPSTLYAAGACLIDMGQEGQTIANGLRPYGLVYDLITNAQVPVDWIINSAKVALTDTDVTIDGTDYAGGPFVIAAPYVSQAQTSLDNWAATGVVVTCDLPSFEAPLYGTITSWPNLVIDNNATPSIGTPYFGNAGIPATAYAMTTASLLTNCDDVFFMPHGGPDDSSTSPSDSQSYANLVPWNLSGGYIIANCHGVSDLEELDGPTGQAAVFTGVAGSTYNASTGANYYSFLTTSGILPANYSGPNAVSASGTYVYAAAGSSPVLQFLDPMDYATQNGDQQVYMPSDGDSWRSTTSLLVADPTGNGWAKAGLTGSNQSAIVAFGRGFGAASAGNVMYQAGHNYNAGQASASNVAAQRAIFNAILMAGLDRPPAVTASTSMAADTSTSTTPLYQVNSTAAPVSISAASVAGLAGTTASSYSWTSSCGGAFSAAGAASGTWTPPMVTAPSNCLLTVTITDSCGRTSFDSLAVTVSPPEASSVTKQAFQGVNPAQYVTPGSALTYVLSPLAPSGQSTNPGSSVTVYDSDPAGSQSYLAGSLIGGGPGYTLNTTLATGSLLNNTNLATWTSPSLTSNGAAVPLFGANSQYGQNTLPANTSTIPWAPGYSSTYSGYTPLTVRNYSGDLLLAALATSAPMKHAGQTVTDLTNSATYSASGNNPTWYGHPADVWYRLGDANVPGYAPGGGTDGDGGYTPAYFYPATIDSNILSVAVSSLTGPAAAAISCWSAGTVNNSHPLTTAPTTVSQGSLYWCYGDYPSLQVIASMPAPAAGSTPAQNTPVGNTGTSVPQATVAGIITDGAQAYLLGTSASGGITLGCVTTNGWRALAYCPGYSFNGLDVGKTDIVTSPGGGVNWFVSSFVRTDDGALFFSTVTDAVTDGQASPSFGLYCVALRFGQVTDCSTGAIVAGNGASGDPLNLIDPTQDAQALRPAVDKGAITGVCYGAFGATASGCISASPNPASVYAAAGSQQAPANPVTAASPWPVVTTTNSYPYNSTSSGTVSGVNVTTVNYAGYLGDIISAEITGGAPTTAIEVSYTDQTTGVTGTATVALPGPTMYTASYATPVSIGTKVFFPVVNSLTAPTLTAVGCIDFSDTPAAKPLACGSGSYVNDGDRSPASGQNPGTVAGLYSPLIPGTQGLAGPWTDGSYVYTLAGNGSIRLTCTQPSWGSLVGINCPGVPDAGLTILDLPADAALAGASQMSPVSWVDLGGGRLIFTTVTDGPQPLYGIYCIAVSAALVTNCDGSGAAGVGAGAGAGAGANVANLTNLATGSAASTAQNVTALTALASGGVSPASGGGSTATGGVTLGACYGAFGEDSLGCIGVTQATWTLGGWLPGASGGSALPLPDNATINGMAAIPLPGRSQVVYATANDALPDNLQCFDFSTGALCGAGGGTGEGGGAEGDGGAGGDEAASDASDASGAESVGSPGTSVTTGQAVYGAAVIPGTSCLVSYGANITSWQLWNMEDLTQGCNYGAPSFSFTDPAPRYCSPATTVTGWGDLTISTTGAAIPVGSTVIYADSSTGSQLGTVTITAGMGGGSTSVTVPASAASFLNYATTPNVTVSLLPAAGQDFAPSTSFTAQLANTTSDGSAPQICYQALVPVCNQQVVNQASVSGAVAGTGYVGVSCASPAKMALTTTVSSAVIDEAGQTINYTFTLTNTGGSPVTDIDITGAIDPSSIDATMSAVSCPSSLLDAGASMVCTATFTVTQAELDNGTITSIATVTGTANNPTSSSNATVTPVGTTTFGALALTVDANPQLTISKTGVGEGGGAGSGDGADAGVGVGVGAGDTVAYSFTLTNSGNITLYGPVMQDILQAPSQTTSLSDVQCDAPVAAAPTAVGLDTAVSDAGAGTDTSDGAGDESGTDDGAAASPAADPSPDASAGSTLGIGGSADGSADSQGDLNSALVTALAANASLATAFPPGSTTTCTATYTVTSADASNGSVVNMAQAQASTFASYLAIDPYNGLVTAQEAYLAIDILPTAQGDMDYVPVPDFALPLSGYTGGQLPWVVMGSVVLAAAAALATLDWRKHRHTART